MFGFVRKMVAKDIAANLESFLKGYMTVFPQGYDSFMGVLEYARAEGLSGNFDANDLTRVIDFSAPTKTLNDFHFSASYLGSEGHFVVVCGGLYESVIISVEADIEAEKLRGPLRVFSRFDKTPTKKETSLIEALSEYELFQKGS